MNEEVLTMVTSGCLANNRLAPTKRIENT